MKKLLKHKKALVITADVLIIPMFFFVRWLSAFMLSIDNPCDWTKVGALCGTCGGTHCVNHFFSFDFLTAFKYNPLVFVGIVYVIIAFVLLNLNVLFEIKYTQKILTAMFSLKAVCIWVALFLIFIVVRNIPFFIRLFNVISHHI